MTNLYFQCAIIIFLFVLSALWLHAAWRHKRALHFCEQYVQNYSALCDEDSIPIDILEDLHKLFQKACHPCAVAYMTAVIVRFRTDKAYRQKIEMTPNEIDHLEPRVIEKLSRTFADLYLYASYTVPIAGALARSTIRGLARKPKDRRKVFLFVRATKHNVNASHPHMRFAMARRSSRH
jgi:hypothetical protein